MREVNRPPPPQQKTQVNLFPIHKDVDPPSMFSPHTVLVRAFSIGEDGRRRHILIPARNSRWVPTKLKSILPSELLPLTSTPAGLQELNVETIGYRIKDGELEVNLLSLKHDSVQLAHGTPIALLHFVSMFRIELGSHEDE